MSITTLQPQQFLAGANTVLPAINFFDLCYGNLPMVYREAQNFVAILKVICDRKQYVYDIIRSLVNVINLNSTDSPENSYCAPSGVYLKMLASFFNVKYDPSLDDSQIINLIQQKVVFVNSRGRIKSFFEYFILNNIPFNNVTTEEVQNATLFFNVPIPDIISPDTTNPLDTFKYSVFKLKAAGVKVNTVGANVPLFEFANLPTDIPPQSTGPGNTGFGGFNPDGVLIGGGNFDSV